MAKVLLKKTLTGWSPADEDSASVHRRHKLGTVLKGTVVQPRNYRHHCLFMALLELTFDNQDKYDNPKMFRRAVALAAGHVDQIITLDGECHLVPLSYDYDTIPDEADFTREFGAAMSVCCGILKMTAPELEGEVSRYADQTYGRAAA
jgi:hypothetical protein